MCGAPGSIRKRRTPWVAVVDARPADPQVVAGAQVWGRYCALCHGPKAMGYVADNAPSLVTTTFLETASDDFLHAGIARGRPGTAMAGYGKAVGGPLDDIRIGQLIAFIRSVEKDTGCSRPPCHYARVWIAKADGTDAHELIPGVATQQELMGWTTDGSSVLYADAGGIFLVDPAGGQPQHVDTGCAPIKNTTPLSCQRDSQVSFSRDGRHISPVTPYERPAPMPAHLPFGVLDE